jgi:hypothetical protein
MNQAKCLEWHRQPLINPVSGRSIKRGGPTYRGLEAKCGPPSRSSRRSPLPSRSSRRSPRRSPLPSRSSRRSPLPQQRTTIYCGNNARDRGLLDGSKVIGTRYQCLKKGIGQGKIEPILTFNDEYEAIDTIKIFCGNGDILPQNKDRFGTQAECLRKGFAVGQKQKYDREGIQQTPIVVQNHGWYKLFLPTALGPVAGIRGGRRR